MKQFNVTITDPEGFHLRSASLLVKEAKKFPCDITIRKGEETANAKVVFEVVGLAIKKDDTITVTLDGENCEEAAEHLQEKLKDI